MRLTTSRKFSRYVASDRFGPARARSSGYWPSQLAIEKANLESGRSRRYDANSLSPYFAAKWSAVGSCNALSSSGPHTHTHTHTQSAPAVYRKVPYTDSSSFLMQKNPRKYEKKINKKWEFGTYKLVIFIGLDYLRDSHHRQCMCTISLLEINGLTFTPEVKITHRIRQIIC